MWVALSIRNICAAISRRYWWDAQKSSSEWIGIQYLNTCHHYAPFCWNMLRTNDCQNQHAWWDIRSHLLYSWRSWCRNSKVLIWWNLSTSLTCSQDVSCSLDPVHLCIAISRRYWSDAQKNYFWVNWNPVLATAMPLLQKHVAHECLSESASLMRYLMTFAYFLKQLMS